MVDYSMGNVFSEGTFQLFLHKGMEVGKSLFLVVLFFFVLQFLVLRLPKSKIFQILFGILYTFLGLVLFLAAVEMAFMPLGFKIGSQLSSHSPLIIIIFAFIIGNVVVLAEPAVHVLNNQVQEITGGEVTKRQMMMALSLGVGISIGLSVLRVYLGFSVLYYLIPGYVISLGLSFFVPKLYTAIAFDSGGVNGVDQEGARGAYKIVGAGGVTVTTSTAEDLLHESVKYFVFGKAVTLTLSGGSSYSAVDGASNPVTLTPNGGDSYTLTMPAADVTISAN